jgi:hypothetical protein
MFVNKGVGMDVGCLLPLLLLAAGSLLLGIDRSIIDYSFFASKPKILLQ